VPRSGCLLRSTNSSHSPVSAGRWAKTHGFDRSVGAGRSSGEKNAVLLSVPIWEPTCADSQGLDDLIVDSHGSWDIQNQPRSSGRWSACLGCCWSPRRRTASRSLGAQFVRIIGRGIEAPTGSEWPTGTACVRASILLESEIKCWFELAQAVASALLPIGP
jgi:hypothetical protein